MVDLDKQFAAMADVSEEDTAYDFVIDEDLRVIAVPERGVVLGVEGDKDANRIRFRMNKTWRGYDMSKFDLRINYQNANGDKNYYTVTSKHTEGNAVVFDWIVAADAVAYQGDVFFIVVGLITTGGMVNCAFHTTLGKAKCLEGLVVDTKTDISEIRDFMATLKAEVEAYGQTFVNAAAASAKAAKASETTAASSASAAKTSETNSVTSAKVAKRVKRMPAPAQAQQRLARQMLVPAPPVLRPTQRKPKRREMMPIPAKPQLLTVQQPQKRCPDSIQRGQHCHRCGQHCQHQRKRSKDQRDQCWHKRIQCEGQRNKIR